MYCIRVCLRELVLKSCVLAADTSEGGLRAAALVPLRRHPQDPRDLPMSWGRLDFVRRQFAWQAVFLRGELAKHACIYIYIYIYAIGNPANKVPNHKPSWAPWGPIGAHGAHGAQAGGRPAGRPAAARSWRRTGEWTALEIRLVGTPLLRNKDVRVSQLEDSQSSPSGRQSGPKWNKKHPKDAKRKPQGQKYTGKHPMNHSRWFYFANFHMVE